jgi:hypothetical protein
LWGFPEVPDLAAVLKREELSGWGLVSKRVAERRKLGRPTLLKDVENDSRDLKMKKRKQK